MLLSNTLPALSALIGAFAFLPMILSSLKRKTQPSATSMVIWTFIGVILFVSSAFSGAYSNLPYIALSTFMTSVLLVVSFRYSKVNFSLIDKICLASACIGIITWSLTRNSDHAVYILSVVDWIGVLPIFAKSYRYPDSENQVSWWLVFLAGFLLTVSISDARPVTVVYAVTQFLQAAIVLMIIFIRKRGSTP